MNGAVNEGIDAGPMARLEEVKRDVNAPSVIFQRMTDGDTLPEIARAWGCPKGRFIEWFTTEHASLWDAAKKVFAADKALEALEISDGPPRQAVTPDGKPLFDDAGKPVLVEPDVKRDKLRIVTRQWLAARADREGYGERSTVRVDVEDKRVPLDRDAAMLETARSLAFIMASGIRVQRERDEIPKLSAPIDVTPEERDEALVPAKAPAKPQEDKSAGII